MLPLFVHATLAFAPAAKLAPTPALTRGVASRGGEPVALLPKAIVPFFFIPTYVQIGYAIEANFFDGKGPCTRLIKSDFVQKSGAQMKRVKKEAPKCRSQKLTPAALAIVGEFKKDYPAKELEFLWGALVKVYGSKDRALAGATANPQILNPSYTFPNTVLESKAQLLRVMSEAEAQEVMAKNPAVLQCGPSLDLFGTDEIRMIAEMRSMGNTMVPAAVRPPLVGLLVASVALTIVSAQGDASSPELASLVGALKPLLAVSFGTIFAGAAYGASQLGRKPA